MLVQIQLSPPSSRISSAIHTNFLLLTETARFDSSALMNLLERAWASQRMILLTSQHRGIAKRLKALVFDISIS